MHLKNYLNSFKPKKELGYTLLVEIIAIMAILALFLSLSGILTYQSNKISDGKSVEEIKALLLSGSEQYNQQFLQNIRGLVLTFAFGGITVLVAILFLFSLSQALVWYKLTQQKLTNKNYWRWNGLNLAVMVLLVVFILLYALIIFTLNTFLPATNTSAWLLRILNILILMAILTIVFSIYYSFSQKYKVWESIGQGFYNLKKHWNKVWKVYLLSLITYVILQLLIYLIALPIVKSTFTQNLMSGISFFLFLVFVSWMRNYVFENIK